jgi:hypothetical protein
MPEAPRSTAGLVETKGLKLSAMGPVGEPSMVSVVDPDADDVLPPDVDAALQAESSPTAMTAATSGPRRRHLGMPLPAFMVVLLDIPGPQRTLAPSRLVLS